MGHGENALHSKRGTKELGEEDWNRAWPVVKKALVAVRNKNIVQTVDSYTSWDVSSDTENTACHVSCGMCNPRGSIDMAQVVCPRCTHLHYEVEHFHQT